MRMFARYNAWANARLYAAAAALSDDARRADRGAFLKSIHGTLCHLLVADRIWMRRFTGAGPTYDRLDATPYDGFDELRRAREGEDARIVAYVDGLDDAALAGVFRYARISSPDEIEQRLAPALAHLFNHQTHHRGQAHALLTGLGVAAPELDLVYYQRAAEQGG